MSQQDTVTLFVNEAAMGGEAGNLERNLGGLEGVRSVEVSGPDQPGTAPSPSLVKRATIAFDPQATNPQALRAALEDLGYAVTAVGELGT
jgi:copper chaperone CopZ